MVLVADLAFVILFLAGGLALVVHLMDRVTEAAGRLPPESVERFSADRPGEELGFLDGGGLRAVAAAVARLRVAGAVTVAVDPRTTKLAATGKPAPDGTALSAAVLAAAAEQPDGIELTAVKDDARVMAVLDDLEREFGPEWRTPDVPPRQFRAAGVPLLALGAIGLAWAAFPPFRWFTDTPLVFLAFFAAVAGVDISREVHTVEPPARRVITTAKRRNGHLAPSENPALLTYGPAAAALAVGLHGIWVMRSTDESLAYASFQELPVDDDDDEGFTAGCGFGEPTRCSSGDAADINCALGCGI